jgi:Ca2+-binding RTX toxin-like protein
MSKHYEAHDRYEGHDDYYYGYNGSVSPAIPAPTATTSASPYYYYDGYDDYYYGGYAANGQAGGIATATPVTATTTATPVTATAKAPAGVILDSDGFAHQNADLSHREVRGHDGYRNAIKGSDGDDVIVGGSRDDILSGGLGSDVISAGAGNDIVIGGGSRDAGINRIDGGPGDDILVAGGQKTSAFSALFAANPLLNTLVHADAKFADIADIIDGTSSTSAALFGALGMASTPVENDFIIHSGNGNDLILNFHAATDKIVVDRVLNGVTIDSASLLQRMVVNGSNVTIDLGQGNSVTLVGVDPASLSAANFVVV